MKLLLAAYTTPGTGALGYRWVWNDPNILAVVLNDIYNSIATSIPDVSSLALNDISAGIICIEKRRLAIYRFLNGGRDAIGREGRVFLICGILDIADASNLNLYEVLNRPEFCTIRDIIPSSTFIECNVEPTGELSASEIQHLKADNELRMSGVESLKKVMSVFKSYSAFATINISITGTLASPRIVVKTKSLEINPPALQDKIILTPPTGARLCQEGYYTRKQLILIALLAFILGFSLRHVLDLTFRGNGAKLKNTGDPSILDTVEQQPKLLQNIKQEPSKSSKEVDVAPVGNPGSRTAKPISRAPQTNKEEKQYE